MLKRYLLYNIKIFIFYIILFHKIGKYEEILRKF